MATGEFISNANLDDRRAMVHLEAHARELVLNADVDLAYSESFVTGVDHETFTNNSSGGKVYPITDFSNEAKFTLKEVFGKVFRLGSESVRSMSRMSILLSAKELIIGWSGMRVTPIGKLKRSIWCFLDMGVRL